jgi:glucoamylase
VQTPSGPSWRRYNGDGYGEHEDGAPFDGTGCGRPWPLLTGERGHYALLAQEDPLPYLQAMARMASPGGMLPEQIWDAPPIPERGLFPGRPSGSAMPLAWTHAEFIKLALSAHEGGACDCPDAVALRYHAQPPRPQHTVWLQQAPVARAFAGADLLVCLHEAAVVRFGIDGWQDIQEVQTEVSGLGLHVARIAASALRSGQHIEFTWRRRSSGTWVGIDYTLVVSPGAVQD